MSPEQQLKVARQILQGLKGLGVKVRLETKLKTIDGQVYQTDTIKVKDLKGSEHDVAKYTEQLPGKPADIKAKLEARKTQFQQDINDKNTEIDNYIAEIDKVM